MQLSKEILQMPSPATYGPMLIKNILAENNVKSNPSAVAEQICFLIRTTNFSVLPNAFSQLLALVSDHNQSAKLRQSYFNVISLVVANFEETNGFHSSVIQFFDGQETFPIEILNKLPINTSFSLTLHSCSSKFAEKSRKYFVSTIIPKVIESPKFLISNSALFHIISLNLENFDSRALYAHCESPNLLTNAPLPEYIPKFVDSEIQVPISDVLIKNDETLLKSPRKLHHLFSFYSDFNEQHVAIFFLSVVRPENRYKAYLEKINEEEKQKILTNIKTVLSSFNVDISKLISKLDVPNFPPLQKESCLLLFQALQAFYDKKQIPISPFTTNWQNKNLQFSLLHYISTNDISGLEFKNSDFSRRINSYLMQSITPYLSKCNKCWLSAEFGERALTLANNNSKKMDYLLDKLCIASPALVMLVIGHSKLHSELIDNKAITALMELIIAPDAATLYSGLWENYSEFLTQTTLNLYHKHPMKIKEIQKASDGQYHYLIMNKDIAFATDLAFAAAAFHPLSGFMKEYTARHGTGSLPKVIDFVKRRSMEPVAKSETYTADSLINFFDFLHSTFETYPIEVRAIIRNAYEACCYARKINRQFVFKLKIPQTKLHEIKNHSSSNFAKLLSGEVSVEKFADDMVQSSTCDPTLFTCTVHYLLMEFQFLDKHTQENIEKLGQLIGLLMLNDCFNEMQKKNIFDFIKHAISEQERSAKFIFACTSLNTMVPNLANYPTYVFEIIRDTPLRDKDPALYEKLQKVDQTMSEPLAINHPKTLKIHPELIARFNNPVPPLKEAGEKLAKLVKEPDVLREVIIICQRDVRKYRFSFVAWYVSRIAMDHPGIVNELAKVTNFTSSDFAKELFMACVYHAIKIILDPNFDKPNGGLIRHRLVVLGKLIGLVTLAEKRPILSRFIDLKKTLLYAFSQGKLYGVVPFVVSIFSVSSPFFRPPNPYTSSILQVFAAIYQTDCLKSTIKNQVDMMFTKMGVNISVFAPISRLFPEKMKDNFDYLMTPFSLLHFVANSDVERITAFDENVYLSFVNSYIYVPYSHTFNEHPELKEKIKTLIAKQSFQFIQCEGKILSKTASKTVLALVTKDLANCEYIKEIAKDVTRQICAGLTMFTAPMRISRSLFNTVRNSNEFASSDWTEQVTTKNYEWISQLLRDVVKVRTWKIVEEKLLEIEKKNNQNKSQNSWMTRIPVANNILRIYSDFGDLSLSQQCYSQYDIQQTKEKIIQTNPAMDEYIKGFHTLISFDGPMPPENTVDEKAIRARILECTTFSQEVPSFERFRSTIKSFLLPLSKMPRHDIETILCRCLERIVKSVPFVLVKQAQKYVLSWMRISIRSPFVVSELIKMGLIVPEELDAVYADSLNSEPFNGKNACYIAQCIQYAIKEAKIIEPRAMISTLSIVTTLVSSHLDFPGAQQYVSTLEELNEIFETMDCEENLLSESTKLSIIPPYISPPISYELNHFKDLLQSEDQDEQAIMDAAHQCALKGKEMFDVLFSNESENTVKQLLKCIQENNEMKPHLKDAIESLQYIITQRGCVMNQDFQVQTTAIFMIISSVCDNLENSLIISNFLHTVRPIKCPSFTIPWISIMSNRNIVYQHLKAADGWCLYAILYTDFIACVNHIDTESESFQMIYKALLRLTLVLVHDFPAFMYEAAQLALKFVSSKHTQLRNIFFSLQPIPDSPKLIIPDVEMPQELTSVLPVLSDTAQCRDELKALFSSSDYQKAFKIANSLFDNLRQENRESLVASKLIHGLIQENIKGEDFTSSDILLRVLAERASTPAPHPPALIAFVRDLLNNNAIWALPCMKASPQTINFFTSLKQAFSKK